MARLPESIRTMYADAYKLHETFCEMGNSAEEWCQCAEVIGNVCRHHENHPMMIALALAVLDQLERERKAEDGAAGLDQAMA